MTGNIQAEEKLEGFINKLALRGYTVEKVQKKPQIYSINGELVNIRSRSRSEQRTYGRRFWYSVTFSVLQYVKWVIYLTTDSDHFMMFPSSFLDSHKDRMYPDRKNAGVGVFDIDWDNEMIVLKEGKVIRVGEYYHDLTDEDYYPRF